ncbi:MAG: 4Fe-4S binding protein [Desulfuromonadales bacterium]|nr:4Fe-4S binding protein [Desulfuromonadales bacterium]
MISIPGKMAKEVLRHSIKPPATRNYPFDKPEMPENFRGKIVFDTEKCIGCKICVKDCPAIAIKITKVVEKKFEAEFYLDRCIYCAQCVDSCPKEALINTKEYELAQIDRKKHRITFHAHTTSGDTENTP